MSKKSNGKKEEPQSSWAPDPEELAEKERKEAERLLKESANPNAPLFQKLDAIITAINGAGHQLCRIADFLEGKGAGERIEKQMQEMLGENDDEEKPKETVESKESPTPQPPDDINAVMDYFPDDLKAKLKFSKKEDGKIKVAPREFLGSENFAKIASIIRGVGGEYVSAGKESHFLVSPATESKSAEQSSQSTAPASKVDEIQGKFPPLLADLLTFTEKDGMVIIKAKQFLGSDNFAKIARIIRDIGGDYISAGKDSRFEVPIK